METTNAIQQIYIGLLGRAADQEGLQYWTDEIEAGTLTLEQLRANIVEEQQEYKDTFGGQTRAQVVSQLYANLFNRAPDDEGLQYWVNGEGASVNIDQLVLALVNGAAAADSLVLDNRTEVANYYTEELGAEGSFDAELAGAVIADVDGTRASVTQTKASVDNGDIVAPGTGGTFTLTTGSDNITGTSGNDTITAGQIGNDAAFTVGDQINGGAGNDTLNWIQTAAVNGLPTGASVQNVETVSVTSGDAITLNTTSGFSGLTALNANTSNNAQTLTASATTDVNSIVAASTDDAISVTGGKNVSVKVTGSVDTGAGAVTVSNAAGTVTTSVTGVYTDGANVASADTTVTGGTTISVTNSTGITAAQSTAALTDTTNFTATQGNVSVTGNASTTTVTVAQDAAVTEVDSTGTNGKIGVVAGTVTVADVNAASATAAGVIETVTLNSYGASTIDSGALKTINLSGTGGTLGVTAGALTTPVVSSLALNVSDLAAAAITLDADYKTLNVASTGKASTIADITGTGVTALNVSGDAALTLTAQTLAAAKTIASTNSAGVTLGTALANDVQFTGGAGNDAISIGATTKAINMGAGDDVVTLSSGTLGAGGSLNGGEGNDTLVANTIGSSFIADPAFSGFETLRVAGAAAQGTHNANGFTALEVGSLNGATTLNNVAAGTGLSVLAATGNTTTVTLANATGTSDSFGLTLKSDAGIAAGTVNVAGVETINITNTDSLTTAASGINTNSLTLEATAATSVVVSGNAGLNLTNTGNTAITNFDASGVQGDAANAAALAVTFVSANTTTGAVVTIKGGSGNDSLTGSATANDTIEGGAGNDTLVYTGGADSFTGGAGNDIFDINNTGTKSAFVTITDVNAGDTIDFAGITTGTLSNNGAFGAKATLGAAATLDQYLDAAADQNGSVNAVAEWFQFGGDTYIVVSNDDGTTGTSAGFTSGTDSVVKLTGLQDLSNDTFAAEVLTNVA